MNYWKQIVAALLCTTTFAVMAQTTPVAGVVTAVQGQRLEITAQDGTKQWVSVKNADAKLDASFIGKKVTGNATQAGDALVLDKPSFSK